MSTLTHLTPRALDTILARFPEITRRDVSLADFSSFGVGGPADVLAVAHTTSELQGLIRCANELAVPFVLIGGGTNLLVADRGIRGLVIKNEIMGMRVSGNRITAGAGEEFLDLIKTATRASLTGFEFAAGIWGTVGGAIYGNAGAYGNEICDVLVECEVMDRAGDIRVEPASYFEFVYRGSKLKRTHEIVLSATVELKPGDQTAIQARVDEILAMRAEKHPRIPNSAGSFFKNIPDSTQPYGKLPAGKLLDAVGAKGMTVGGARVFEKHANILVNYGGATAQDIRRLADTLKRLAFERHGILLEEEVVVLGEFD